MPAHVPRAERRALARASPRGIIPAKLFMKCFWFNNIYYAIARLLLICDKKELSLPKRNLSTRVPAHAARAERRALARARPPRSRPKEFFLKRVSRQRSLLHKRFTLLKEIIWDQVVAVGYASGDVAAPAITGANLQRNGFKM